MLRPMGRSQLEKEFEDRLLDWLAERGQPSMRGKVLL